MLLSAERRQIDFLGLCATNSYTIHIFNESSTSLSTTVPLVNIANSFKSGKCRKIFTYYCSSGNMCFVEKLSKFALDLND